MSQLFCETELMLNQKHADVMAPDIAFEVIQAATGEALFFSIGTDHVFYVTREVNATATGWNRLDLSSTLAPSVAAKSFAVTQNTHTHAFDIALVATIAGSDYLYLSLGNSSEPASWSGGITWTAITSGAPTPLTIADVYLMQIPNGSSSTENCFVDVVRNPKDPLQELDRYYILPTSSTQWNRHTLAVDLSAGSIYSCLGNRTNDFVPGIYTFGSIGGVQELIFASQYNAFRPTIPPTAVRLTLPTGATSIASALNSSGVSNLFVAAPAGLYLFTPSNQNDGAQPLQVINGSIFAGALSLSASTAGTQTAVWGLNAQNELYYTSCPAGSEANPGSWSVPVPVCTGAESFAFYLNTQAPSNVLFAHLNGQNMIQLSQDPNTGSWLQRSILLPPTAIDDMVQYYTFTTHIQVTDANGVNAPNTPVSLSAAMTVSLYINDTYYVLSPAVSLQVTADSTGVITIIQEAQSLQGACFRITLTNSPSVFVDVNPMSNAFQALGSIKSGTDLSNVQITTASGTTKPLLPSSVPAADKSAAATAITQLVQVSASLPPDGSKQTSPVTTTSALKLQAADLSVVLPSGNLFQWLKSEWNKVENYIVQKVEGFWHMVVNIAGKVYDAILDSLPAVANALQFIFNKLEATWDDLVAWLGFIFKWDDIIRTHKVMKNIFLSYAQHAVDQISTFETTVQSMFDQLESRLNDWAKIPDTDSTIGSQTLSSSKPPGFNTPQANWALQQMKSNHSAAASTYALSTPTSSTIDQVLSQLDQLITQEESNVTTMVNQIKSDIIDNIYNLTPVGALKKLVAIMGDLLINSAETAVTTLLQLLQIIVNGLLDMLKAPIDIPVLSSIYQSITGDPLSCIDVICLIGAIPSTIIFKLSTGQTPFPDNNMTTALVNATDFATLSSLIAGSKPVSVMKVPEDVTALKVDSIAATSTSLQPTAIVNAVLDLGAAFGSVGLSFFAAIKWGLQTAEEPVPIPISILNFGFYVQYTAPAFSTAWSPNPSAKVANILNDIVTCIAIIKTLGDTVFVNVPGRWPKYISPVLEMFINIAWLGVDIDLYVEISGPKASDKYTLASSILFDLGGIIAPGTSKDIVRSADVAAGFFGAAEGLTLMCGLMDLCAAIKLLQQS